MMQQLIDIGLEKFDGWMFFDSTTWPMQQDPDLVSIFGLTSVNDFSQPMNLVALRLMNLTVSMRV